MTTLASGTRRPAAPPTAEERQDAVAIAVFATWMVTGLFLDGWAHQAQKPETFFSPWHGVLYSGFGAAVAWFALQGFLRRRRGVAEPANDRLVSIGLVLFGAGAVGDFVWHEAFGIEVDIEALLSPTHLALMTGGLLMATAPVRQAWSATGRSPSARELAPAVVTLTLATAVASFFTMYLSAFVGDAASREVRGLGELLETWGIASILVTNALLLAPTVLVLRRWSPPFGTFLVLYTGVATLMSGLEAFDRWPLVGAAAVGGLAADLLARRASPHVVAAVVPLVLWSAWFAVHALVWGVVWTVELWTGSIILASLTGVGLALLAFPPTWSGELEDRAA